jgi:SPP1 family phage portal protein
MEEILKLLRGSEPHKAINLLISEELNPFDIDNFRAEHDDLKRDLRRSQVGRIQKDKTVKGRPVNAVKIPVPFQNRIVTTSTAFEVGEPITLVPEVLDTGKPKNDLTKEIDRLWKVNRLDNKLQKLIKLKKSETQSAILFYTQKTTAESRSNRLRGTDSSREIKSKVLENKNGRMAPYYDPFGDMVAFTWSFDTTVNGKTLSNVWVYTDTKVFKMDNRSGKASLVSEDRHGFTKIPVVYFEQDNPEWFVAQPMIDRIEVAMSKLGASNDYSGHPILMLYGEVEGAPDKDEDGKALRFNMIRDEADKMHHGDAKFLTHDEAPESVRMELDRLEKYIYTMTSTPDISFDNIKGLGDVSGVAIRLMFLDAIMKAKLNEGDNRTAVERMVNVMVSGVTTTTKTGLKEQARDTIFGVQFNSILPDDLRDSVETYSLAVQTGIMSVESAVETLDLSPDAERELANIGKDQARKQQKGEDPTEDNPPAPPTE